MNYLTLKLNTSSDYIVCLLKTSSFEVEIYSSQLLQALKHNFILSSVRKWWKLQLAALDSPNTMTTRSHSCSLTYPTLIWPMFAALSCHRTLSSRTSSSQCIQRCFEKNLIRNGASAPIMSPALVLCSSELSACSCPHQLVASDHCEPSVKQFNSWSIMSIESCMHSWVKKNLKRSDSRIQQLHFEFSHLILSQLSASAVSGTEMGVQSTTKKYAIVHNEFRSIAHEKCANEGKRLARIETEKELNIAVTLMKESNVQKVRIALEKKKLFLTIRRPKRSCDLVTERTMISDNLKWTVGHEEVEAFPWKHLRNSFKICNYMCMAIAVGDGGHVTLADKNCDGESPILCQGKLGFDEQPVLINCVDCCVYQWHVIMQWKLWCGKLQF